VQLLLACAAISLAAAGGYFAWQWVQLQMARQEAFHLVNQGQLAEAEPLLQRLLSARPEDVEVVRALARSRMVTRQLEEAEAYLNRWIELRPNDTSALNHRITIWLETKRLPLAIADARRVLELEPDQADVRRLLAQWLVNVGSYEEAERECIRCEQQRPGDPGLILLRAEIAHRKGEAGRAVALTEQLLRDFPAVKAAKRLRAILHLESGEPDRAIPLLREVLAAPGEPRQVARYYLSLALSQTGQQDEARKVQAEMEAEEALKLWAERGHEPNPGLLLRAAESLLAVGKVGDAERLLDKVLEQYPDCQAAHRLLSVHYEKQGQFAKAAEHKRRAEP
jgi:predicted Zn-dependent protease